MRLRSSLLAAVLILSISLFSCNERDIENVEPTNEMPDEMPEDVDVVAPTREEVLKGWDEVPVVSKALPSEDSDLVLGPLPPIPEVNDVQAVFWQTTSFESSPVLERVPDIRLAVRSGMLDPTLWEVENTTVLMFEEELILSFPPSTDEAASVQSISIPVYRGDVVIAERRIYHPIPEGKVEISFEILAGPEDNLQPVFSVYHHGEYRVGGRREIVIEGTSSFAAAVLDAGFDEWLEERMTFDTASGRGMYEVTREDGSENTVIVRTPVVDEGSASALRCARITSENPYPLHVDWFSISIRRGPNAWVEVDTPQESDPVESTDRTSSVVSIPDSNVAGTSLDLFLGSPSTPAVSILSDGTRLRFVPGIFPTNSSLRITPYRGAEGPALLVEALSGITAGVFPIPLWATFTDGTEVPILSTGLIRSTSSEIPMEPETLRLFPPFKPIATVLENSGTLPDRDRKEEELRSYVAEERRGIPILTDERIPEDLVILSALEKLFRENSPGLELQSGYERWIDGELLRSGITGTANLDEARTFRQAILTRTVMVLDYLHENSQALLVYYRRDLTAYLEEVLDRSIVVYTTEKILFLSDEKAVFRVQPPGTVFTLREYLAYGSPLEAIYTDTGNRVEISPETILSGVVEL